jgi:hypothetical protein
MMGRLDDTKRMMQTTERRLAAMSDVTDGGVGFGSLAALWAIALNLGAIADRMPEREEGRP